MSSAVDSGPLVSEIVSEFSQGFLPESRFASLRSVQWRINLGILPSSADSSIEDLRRVAADSRRRYAGLRRHLLVDPHIPKDEDKAPDLIMDNPLSQNPDSMWGRFFRNAELERMVDQDLSRLYPEHGSYFQTAACQAILRRILLLWCLKHSEFGYRQGMHELLAPLLYVLHVDVQRLSAVRELYEDVFTDRFDGMSTSDSDLYYSRTSSPVSSTWGVRKDNADSFEEDEPRFGRSLDELDADIKTIVLLSDAYGAEGELGILLSERFMEHDAYCMFDALMSGAHGIVAMADYFSSSPVSGSVTGLPPIIEASSALYHLLSLVDSSLHSHLVELGVEPQYFSLRWLRVLFGREFLLEDLLIIWDEILASANSKPGTEYDSESVSHFIVLTCPRGAFIVSMAVSMLLYLRSSLLATENATACLQRLLNFPENVNLKKLMDKAKSLQALALETSTISSPSSGASGRGKPTHVRGYSISSSSVSPKTPLNLLPESYWEEKWRVLNSKENSSHGSPSDKISTVKKISLIKDRLRLSRSESAPSSTKSSKGKAPSQSSARRSLLDDLSKALGESEGDGGNCGSIEDLAGKNTLLDGAEKGFADDPGVQCAEGSDEACGSGHIASEENSSIFSDSTGPCSGSQDHENESEKSSVTSNSYIYDNEDEINDTEACIGTMSKCADSKFREDSITNKNEAVQNGRENPRSTDKTTIKNNGTQDGNTKQIPAVKERRSLSGKLQWFWRFGRNNGEVSTEKGGHREPETSENTVSEAFQAEGCNNDSHKISDQSRNVDEAQGASSSNADEDTSGLNVAPDMSEKNVMSSLRNIGQSMSENIQVIESVFQQERGQVGSLESLSRNILSGKGQVTAMAALKELRKISNLLSEM